MDWFSEECPKGMPAYEFIKRELRAKIDGGQLLEGERVPSEYELVRQLGISRNQTRQALRDLELDGYLVRHPGKGSFVAPASMRLQRLASPGVKMVAMAASGLHSAYRRAVIEGFARRFLREGVHSLMSFLECSREAELRFLDSIRGTGVIGLALWVRQLSDDMKEMLTRFRHERFPFVLCDRYLPGFEADFVGSDNIQIGYALTQALIAQEHRRIAFLAQGLDITTTFDRLEGYRRALAEVDIEAPPDLTAAVGDVDESAQKCLCPMLARRDRPTALVCVDDRVASRVLRAIQTLGYRVPEDMAIAAVDDGDSGLANSGVPVVWAKQAADTIGVDTAEMLMERIANPNKALEIRLVHALRLPGDTLNGGQSAAGVSEGSTPAKQLASA